MSEIGMFRQVESVLRYTSQPQGEFHARIERSGAAHFFAALGTNRSCLLYVRSRQPVTSQSPKRTSSVTLVRHRARTRRGSASTPPSLCSRREIVPERKVR